MRIFGIDPGLQKTGWGVVDVAGNRLSHVAHGIIRTDIKQETAARLRHLFVEMSLLLEQWKPTHAAIEETFVNSNPQSALKLGLARGVVMMAPSHYGVTVAEYPPTLIKKSIVGSGHAEKSQVQMMIKVLLRGIEAPSDAADALAVAICHAHHGATKDKIGGIMSGAVR
ncbi:MAG TPA: crossover junction endodeoxyribonuclease RuvC [Patescibacteria group bacterium]|nr:crossover junction endodeoxyribonuclease RuvC [Patescibacteria group bacterium]